MEHRTSDIKYGTIFKRTLSSYQNGSKIIIHKGGTGSGKTFDLMIFIIFAVAMRERNRIITIVSESRPHLDIGVIRIMKQLMVQANVFNSYDFNSTSGLYKLKSGSIIEFFSADRIDKALGARRYMLYGNEINSLKFEVWDELARRSEIVIGDFNPTQQFWLEKFIEYYGDVDVILSNYLDNPFLPETERNRIIRRAMIDPNFRRIHVDCEYGSYEGLIFPEFILVDEIPVGLNHIFGQDFGFTNDPSALIDTAVSGSDLYLDELFYRTQLTNADIISLYKANGIRQGYDEIEADSAEPKSIEEIRRAGFNIKSTEKGPDSIRTGIDTMKQFKIHVTKRSVNLIKELRNYSWVMDSQGNATNKPIDAFNHAIDAARYGTKKHKAAKLKPAKFNF